MIGAVVRQKLPDGDPTKWNLLPVVWAVATAFWIAAVSSAPLPVVPFELHFAPKENWVISVTEPSGIQAPFLSRTS